MSFKNNENGLGGAQESIYDPSSEISKHPVVDRYQKTREALGNSSFQLSEARWKDEKGNQLPQKSTQFYYDNEKMTPLREKGTRLYWEASAEIADALVTALKAAETTLVKLKAALPKFGLLTRGVEVPTFLIKSGDLPAPNHDGPPVEFPLFLDGPHKKMSKAEVQKSIDDIYAMVRSIQGNQLFQKRSEIAYDAVGQKMDGKLNGATIQRAYDFVNKIKEVQELLKTQFGHTTDSVDITF
jgi:hypothetical protein